MSSSLYAVFVDLHRRSASSTLALSSVDNPTVRMSLFALVFLLLLALGSLSLSRIIVLVLHHTPMIYAVVLFLLVSTNLCVTKLLLFPTIQKPDRHLVMVVFSDAMKPEKFTGVNSKRWQTRAQLWLSAMGMFSFVSNPPALPLGSEKEV